MFAVILGKFSARSAAWTLELSDLPLPDQHEVKRASRTVTMDRAITSSFVLDHAKPLTRNIQIQYSEDCQIFRALAV